MTSVNLTQNLSLIENINHQVKYFHRVLLKQFSSAIHNTSTNDDALVEEFSEAFYQTLINELENYKQKFQFMSNDLETMQSNFENSIPLVDEVDDSIHQYELYLVTTTNLLDGLLNQLDIEITKLSKKI